MTRQFEIREPSLAALKEAPVYFRYGSNKRRVLIDALTANAILTVHAACNPDNQAKLERMVAGTFGQFERVASFALKSVTIR